ncbi:MAG: 30S ribosomal protein S1 [Acidimicrobiia bacterium]|nr:30S ribosomal protein S1 [Acidimicrobiia bacterium]
MSNDTTTTQDIIEQGVGETPAADTSPDVTTDALVDENADTEVGADTLPGADATPVEPVPRLPWEEDLPFEKGDVIDGDVVKIDLETVIVDLAAPVEGVLPVREVVHAPYTFADEVVTIGERIRVVVTSTDAPDGHPRLSLTRLAEQEAWEKLRPSIEAGEPITATVSEVVKGGLRLDIGVDAFLPASLIDLRPVSDMSGYLGQELSCRVIEADPKRRKIVLSRKAVLEEERSAKADELFASLEEGQVVSGSVSSVTDIGLFVDVGGADGLVHSSELAWGRPVHPKKAAQPGDEVEVKVLAVDREKRRISLSIRQLAENPWDKFVREHSVGEVVTGRVVKNADFGSFVEVLPGVEGLVHVSELSPTRVDKPSDVVAVGDEVQARIVEIDLARNRLGLSIRAVENPELAGKSQKSGAKGGKGKRDRRTRGVQSFGESSGAGPQTQISAKSMRALDALKAQLAGDEGDAVES